jgi:hypothetical protein
MPEPPNPVPEMVPKFVTVTVVDPEMAVPSDVIRPEA